MAARRATTRGWTRPPSCASSRSELKVGGLVPKLPTIQPNYGRLFPQVFQGALLTSGELSGLSLNLGRLTEVSQRNEAGTSDLALFNRNRRFAGAAQADRFDLAGLDYRIAPDWTGSYHYGELEQVYAQHFLGLKGRIGVAADSLESDLRLALSRDTGGARGGRIDNRSFSGSLTYRLRNGQAFGLGYQRMSGDHGFPTWRGPIRTWSISASTTTSPRLASPPGNCATTATSRRSGCPA